VEKNIISDKKFSREQLLDKKIDIFQKQTKEIEKLQKYINVEINKIKES